MRIQRAKIENTVMNRPYPPLGRLSVRFALDLEESRD